MFEPCVYWFLVSFATGFGGGYLVGYMAAAPRRLARMFEP